MSRSIICLIAAAIVLLVCAGNSFAGSDDSKPFQASLVPEVAIYDPEVKIQGLSIGVWSENPQKALSLGFVSGSTAESYGFSWSFLMNYADTYKGVHWSAVNYTKQEFTGWQSGIVNYTQGRFQGLQSGWFNYAGNMKGLQLGLVNYAETAKAGVQLGLGNIIRENSWFKDMPDSLSKGMAFINWRF